MKALIADDEPLLAQHLCTRLKALWPELEIAGLAANGIEARQMIEDVKPDIAFLDIRMPGLTGLDVVQALSPAARAAWFSSLRMTSSPCRHSSAKLSTTC